MARLTIQDVLRRGFDAYCAGRKLPAFQIHAAQQMMACRTAALGGHIQMCPNGHVRRVWYNSCQHRACPQCSWLRLETWLARQKARLVDCPHYHVVFTIPDGLHPLWRYNRKLMADLLFRAVRDTLFKLLGDPKYLGATPGLITVLYTWGKTLQLHPHIHCLVTGGGLTQANVWRTVVKDLLLPRKVLMIIFRAKYLDAVRTALARGELKLPPDMTPARVRGLLNKLGRTVWNVKILDKYDHGRGVVCYLARYLRGGPISNRRLVRCRSGHVRFRYQDNRDLDSGGRARHKTMTLATEVFLKRLLEHVPLPRQHMVRSYGLYANNQAERLDQARARLGQDPLALPEPIRWIDLWEQLGSDRRPDRCPVCGAAIVQTELIPPTRAPPAADTATPSPQTLTVPISLQNTIAVATP